MTAVYSFLEILEETETTFVPISFFHCLSLADDQLGDSTIRGIQMLVRYFNSFPKPIKISYVPFKYILKQ